MPKHPGGRPPKLTLKQREEVVEALIDYIAVKDDPTLVGFCARDLVAIKYGVTKDNLYDWEEFAELRKLAIAKQEAYLLEGATRNRLNATVAIFRLKQPQHGYTDRTQTDLTTNGKDLPTPILGGVTKGGDDGTV